MSRRSVRQHWPYGFCHGIAVRPPPSSFPTTACQWGGQCYTALHISATWHRPGPRCPRMLSEGGRLPAESGYQVTLDTNCVFRNMCWNFAAATSGTFDVKHVIYLQLQHKQSNKAMSLQIYQWGGPAVSSHTRFWSVQGELKFGLLTLALTQHLESALFKVTHWAIAQGQDSYVKRCGPSRCRAIDLHE